VSDNGSGFSAEALSRLFAPFSRGDSPRQEQGNGLGLAIARAAVLRHGGRLEIVARPPGTGAVVEIRLPFDQPRIG
jgi:two-component system OmpR family sensor kinase